MNTRKIGKLGEDIACNYLKSRGFTVIARNYLRRWGEIDIVAEKENVIHFFEVKSVTDDFSHVTNAHKPEENVHPYKLKHIGRMIETFMFDKGHEMNGFKFHVLTVRINRTKRLARVEWLKDIIF